MPSSDLIGLRCTAPYRARRWLYRALAHELAAAPPPAGAVFESVGADPIPWVTVRPSSVARAVLRANPGQFDPVEVGPVRPAPAPPPLAVDRVGVVVAEDRPAPEPAEPAPLFPPRAEAPCGPRGWVAAQTFWLRGEAGGLWAARRFRAAFAERSEATREMPDLARAIAREWSGDAATTVVFLAWPGALRRWRRRGVDRSPPGTWRPGEPAALAAAAEVRALARPAATPVPPGPAVVFGASGAGKTTYLARRAAAALRAGTAVVVLDLHGDLTPSLMARLAPAERSRVHAIDASDPPVPGISVLPPGPDEDRTAAVLVAAVKRLSADGTDVYWGFRLERIYDSLVRLVLESGGDLLDLYDLLTSEDRREAARLATRRPELARFLEELAPVVRRNPEFLWPAATRLSKVVLVPVLADLLAPGGEGLPVERILEGGDALLVRLPVGRLGPEAATLAGTLLLARIFLGLAGASSGAGARPEVLLVLDEVQGFSPRLVAEVLAEGRKHGLRPIIATQYPERLAPDLRAAAAGASTQFVAFRVPPAAAAEAGAWLGLDRRRAETVLPDLPPGRGLELDPATGGLEPVLPEPEPPGDPPSAWSAAVERTREDLPPRPRSDPVRAPAVAERLLLAVLAAEEEGRPLAEPGVVPAALALPGPRLDPAELADAWPGLVRAAAVSIEEGRLRLSESGARRIGLGGPTGATRESAEHRRLLLATFRIFARRGYRLEIVRQGRYDTRLPDARFRQIADPLAGARPARLAEELDRARSGWAWRYFGGRDVHVEAEVSGAPRTERIRHGWRKADQQGAQVLFVVGAAAHARKVRAALGRLGVGRDRAFVWTLPGALGPRRP